MDSEWFTRNRLSNHAGSWSKSYPQTQCFYRVVDLPWIPDQAFWSTRIQVRIKGFWWPKLLILQLKKILFFSSKTAIYLSLCLYEGRPSYRRCIQYVLEREHSVHQNMKFLLFLVFLWVIFALPYQSMQIRIHHTSFWHFMYQKTNFNSFSRLSFLQKCNFLKLCGAQTV